MINAVVIVLVAGLSLAMGWIIGSRLATKNVLAAVEEDYDVAVIRDLFEELLANPDTSYHTRQALLGYKRSRSSYNVEFNDKGQVHSLHEVVLDSPPNYGDAKFVVDSAVQRAKESVGSDEYEWGDHRNEFYDGVDDPTSEEGLEQWIASYESAMETKSS